MKEELKALFLSCTRFTFHNRKFLYLFYLVNLLFSVGLSLPAFALLKDNLGHSVMGKTLLSDFDLLWLFQFLNVYKGPVAIFPYYIFSLVGIYFILQMFFSGGIMAVYLNPKRNHISDFFYGGVRYFYRFLKITIPVIGVYTLIFQFNNFLTYVLTTLTDSAIYYILPGLQVFLFLVCLTAVNLFADYCKVAGAVRDTVSFKLMVTDAYRFLRRRFWFAFPVYVLIASFVGIAGTIYSFGDSFIPKSNEYLILIAFVIQQFLIIFRFFIRMLFYTTEIYLFTDHSAEVVNVQVEELNNGEH